MKIRNTIIALALATLSATTVVAQTEVFFGQDTGVGQKGRIAEYPNSKAEFERFKARCGNVEAVDFESLKPKYTFKQWGTTEERKYSYYHVLEKAAQIKMVFGDHETATLDGMTQVIKVTNQNATMAGGFPTSGETAMLLISASGNADATISFDRAQAAFGFYVTDIEKNSLKIDLLRDGEKPEAVNFAKMSTGPNEPNGGICFVGVINKNNPFKGVKLTNPGGGSEGFGFDDMMIARPEQIQPPQIAVVTTTDPEFPGEVVVVKLQPTQPVKVIDAGDSKKTKGDAQEHIITQAQSDQHGAVWSEAKIDFTRNFTISADIYLGTKDDDGADGIALVFQTKGNDVVSTGSGIGYRGFLPSVAIEFDTYQNRDECNDPVSDHVGLRTNGDPTHVGSDYVEVGNLEDGRYHPITFAWNASAQTFNLTLDGKLLFKDRSVSVNGLTRQQAHVGFTAATGFYSNMHKVRAISLAQ